MSKRLPLVLIATAAALSIAMPAPAGTLGRRWVEIVPGIAHHGCPPCCDVAALCNVGFTAVLHGPWSSDRSVHWHTALWDDNYYGVYSITVWSSSSSIGDTDHIWVRVTDNSDGFSATGNSYMKIHDQVEYKVTSDQEEDDPESHDMSADECCCQEEGMDVEEIIQWDFKVKGSVSTQCGVEIPLDILALKLGVDTETEFGCGYSIGQKKSGHVGCNECCRWTWHPVWRVRAGTCSKWKCDGTKTTCTFSTKEFLRQAYVWQSRPYSCP